MATKDGPAGYPKTLGCTCLESLECPVHAEPDELASLKSEVAQLAADNEAYCVAARNDGLRISNLMGTNAQLAALLERFVNLVDGGNLLPQPRVYLDGLLNQSNAALARTTKQEPQS